MKFRMRINLKHQLYSCLIQETRMDDFVVKFHGSGLWTILCETFKPFLLQIECSQLEECFPLHYKQECLPPGDARPTILFSNLRCAAMGKLYLYWFC